MELADTTNFQLADKEDYTINYLSRSSDNFDGMVKAKPTQCSQLCGNWSLKAPKRIQLTV